MNENEVCTACDGMGWLRQDVPVTHPDFGKFVACQAPGHTRLVQAQRLARSGLEEHERAYSFSGILPLNRVTTEMVEAVKAVLERGHGWLYVWGSYGNAKSVSLMAAVAETIAGGKPAYYTTFNDLLEIMRATFKYDRFTTPAEIGDTAWESWMTYQQRFNRLRDIALLAIDEFDPEKVNLTRFASAFQAQLMDRRYRSAEGERTMTIFAGNQNPQVWPAWMKDRIEDGRFSVFHQTAPSVRKKLKSKTLLSKGA